MWNPVTLPTNLKRIYIYPVPFQDIFTEYKIASSQVLHILWLKDGLFSCQFCKANMGSSTIWPSPDLRAKITVKTRAGYPFSHLILSSVVSLLSIDEPYLLSQSCKSNLQWLNSGL